MYISFIFPSKKVLFKLLLLFFKTYYKVVLLFLVKIKIKNSLNDFN